MGLQVTDIRQSQSFSDAKAVAARKAARGQDQAKPAFQIPDTAGDNDKALASLRETRAAQSTRDAARLQASHAAKRDSREPADSAARQDRPSAATRADNAQPKTASHDRMADRGVTERSTADHGVTEGSCHGECDSVPAETGQQDLTQTDTSAATSETAIVAAGENLQADEPTTESLVADAAAEMALAHPACNVAVEQSVLPSDSQTQVQDPATAVVNAETAIPVNMTAAGAMVVTPPALQGPDVAAPAVQTGVTVAVSGLVQPSEAAKGEPATTVDNAAVATSADAASASGGTAAQADTKIIAADVQHIRKAAPDDAGKQVDAPAFGAQERFELPPGFSPLPRAAAHEMQAKAVAEFASQQAQVPETRPTPLNAVPLEIGLKAMAGNKRFDIRLDPAELGRVDVSLNIDDDGNVSAKLVVDRVETLHMLQRDARTLERAFEQAGLKPSDGGVELSLRDQTGQQGSQQANQEQQNQNSRRMRAHLHVEPEVADIVAIRRAVAPGRVDLSI